MRILYIDIDTLRPDHLSCYGYHRKTSPNIDWVASHGVRFENCYVSDSPCLPSRAALYSGRFGIHNGAINHGGVAADLFHEGSSRGFRDRVDKTSWIPQMRRLGLRPVSVSPFGERHSSWWWYAGWKEVYNPGLGGMESAEEVTPLATDWLQRNAKSDNWILHVNYWDPHTPYRAPQELGNPFADDPIPGWITEEFRQKCWDSFGPHSAQEPHHDLDGSSVIYKYPRVPRQIDSMTAVKQWFDGYDTGVWYSDKHVGYLLEELDRSGVLNETVIMISSDHGENLGELNVWGDHQSADHITNRVPLIIKWPGLVSESRIEKSYHYQFDWTATMIELLGGTVPGNWDAKPFPESFKNEKDIGREFLVLSQAAWSCQRSVRFSSGNEEYICMQTYHDGYKDFDPIMLFNLSNDPHEQKNLATQKPEIVDQGLAYLANWLRDQMVIDSMNIDPMAIVLREGGPFHTRGTLARYVEHLRKTGREHHAERLIRLYPREYSI